MNNPVEWFFSWGNRYDAKTKAKWDMYLLLSMFIAFFTVFVSNFNSFLESFGSDFMLSLKYLGWSGVMVAIMWFQYFGLKSAYEFNKLLKGNKEEKIETKEEMLKLFKEKK